jgi:YD repeat-containing protein
MNGSTQQQYEYDDLYRLTKASGKLNSSKGDASYSLTMEYDNLHNITSKKLGHTVFGSYPAESNYDLDYTYRTDKPHALAEVNQKMTTTVDQTRHYTYNYDSNGNMTGYNWPEHYRLLT